MKLERIKRRTGGSLILEMTPLIDVVFLLLIFFMLATTFNDNATFKIDLPQTNTKKNIKTIRELQILIDKDKNIFLKYDFNSKTNQETLNKNNIVSQLSSKIQNSENKTVIISADKSIDYGFVVEIMSFVKEAGANSIDIDTAIKR